MGANAVYLTNQRTEGNKIGYFSSSSAETNLTGVACTNRLPDFNAFKELLDRHKGKMTQVLEVSLGGSSTGNMRNLRPTSLYDRKLDRR